MTRKCEVCRCEGCVETTIWKHGETMSVCGGCAEKFAASGWISE